MKFIFLILVAFLLINCDSSSNADLSSKHHRLIEQRMYSDKSVLSKYWLYEYDSSKNLVKTENYDSLDNLMTYVNYEYNTKGQSSDYYTYDSDSKLKYHNVSIYGEDGCLESKIFSNADGDLLSTSAYNVDPNTKNLLSYSNTFEGGSVYNKVFLYDNSGKRTKTLRLSTSGDTIGYSDYKYNNGILDSVILFYSNGDIENIRVFIFEQKESTHNIFESGVW